MKRILKYILLILLLMPSITFAEGITYADAQKTTLEVMKSYYIRGERFQYNFAKNIYGTPSPEDATSQDTYYMVCSAFSYNVYKEAFGMGANTMGLKNSSGGVLNFPQTTGNITDIAKAYYDQNGVDNKFTIYYATKDETATFSTLVNKIKPGDIFAHSGGIGHVLIAYDVTNNPNTGTEDVLLLNVTASKTSVIGSPITHTISNLSYNKKQSPYGTNNIINVDIEGTTKYIWLSDYSGFMKNGSIKCQDTACAVIRPFYNDNGNAHFNFEINNDQYEKSKLRTEYPGLMIEKTVNVGDNNSVYLGDELKYTIKITNKSSVTGTGKDYSSFVIEEALGDNVEYQSSDNNATVSNNKIKWTISGLSSNATKTITYTIKVKNNIWNVNKQIEAIGKFYKENNSNVYITTGTVSNLIAAREFVENETYKNCYNSNKTKTGLTLIQAIYECAGGTKVDFTNFAFENLLNKQTNITVSQTNAIIINPTDDNYTNISKMILNNYWGGTTILTSGSKVGIPRWLGSDTNTRAKTINPTDFKDGDILIYYTASNSYTNENGTYAYIYIDDKFVGNNYSGTKARSEFTYNYYSSDYTKLYGTVDNYGFNNLSTSDKTYVNYQTLFGKDYYVILRPNKILNDITFTTSNYGIDNNKRIIYKIDKNTTVNSLRIETSANISIIDKSNNVVTTKVKTGDMLKAIFGAETNSPLSYKMSVKGDTLGTGNVNKASAQRIAKHIIDGNVITGDEYLYAADYNGNGNIKMNDVVKLLKGNN